MVRTRLPVMVQLLLVLLVLLVAPPAGATTLPFVSPGRAVDFGNPGVGVEVGDFDGDGVEDLAILEYTSRSVLDQVALRVRFGPVSSFGVAQTMVGLPGSLQVAAHLFAGDVTGDGRADLLVVSDGRSQIYRCAAARTLEPVGSSFTVSHVPIALGDFDGDDDFDLLTSSGTILGLWRNDGGGNFTAAPEQAVSFGYSSGGAVADFDGDQILDFAGAAGIGVGIARGLGDGTFQSMWAGFGLPGAALGMVATDLDGDDDPDLVVGRLDGSALHPYRNDGAGTFFPQAPVPTTLPGYRIAAHDVDGDGAPDVVISGASNAILELCRGLGDASLGAAETLPTGFHVRDFATLDVDDDGRRDLLVLARYDVTLAAHLARSPLGDYASRVPTGSEPRAIAIGDVTGDGRRDFLVLGRTPAVIAIHASEPSGTAWTRTDLPIELAPSDLHLADVDRDGRLDLVTIHGVNGLAIRRGLGGGTFAGPVVLTTPSQPQLVRSADLDQDGVLELIVACGNTIALRTFRGLGGGVFGTGIDVVSPAGTGAVAGLLAVDTSQDGRADLVVLNRTQGLYVFLALPGGGFAEALTLPVGGVASGLDFGDLNGDTIFDLIVSREGDGGLARFHGTGDGAFASASAIYVGNDAKGVQATDFDGDGILDLVGFADGTRALPSLGAVITVRGLGGGEFEPAVGLLAGVDPRVLALGDVTGDSRPDVIVASPAGPWATILANPLNGPVAVTPSPGLFRLAVRVAPSPAFGPFGVALTGIPDEPVRVEIFTVNGRRVGAVRETRLGADGRVVIRIGAGTIPGVYLVRAVQRHESVVARAVILP